MQAWWFFALVSAAAAAGTSILAEMGVVGIPSAPATAVGTAIVLAFSLAVLAASGQYRTLAKLDGKSLGYLVASGVLTGVSWLAFLRALELGPVARVVAIDKTSLAMTVLLAVAVLG